MTETNTPPWTVLLIVKDTMVRDLISLVVERLGGRIFAVDNEKAALEAVADREPAVVILDLLVPGINSIVLLQEIKVQADPFLKGLIAISGLAYREVVTRTIAAGATDFLLKPIDTEQLAARLEKIVLT